jgi:hypothetical protein
MKITTTFSSFKINGSLYHYGMNYHGMMVVDDTPYLKGGVSR